MPAMNQQQQSWLSILLMVNMVLLADNALVLMAVYDCSAFRSPACIQQRVAVRGEMQQQQQQQQRRRRQQLFGVTSCGGSRTIWP